MFNATFNNISAISWRSVLLVEETTDLSQVTVKLYHIMLHTSPWSRFKLTTSVVIDRAFIWSCRNSTSTLYSTAGYFLCIKDKKCIIYSQSRYRDNDHVFFPHYQSLIIVMTIDLSTVNNTSQTGRRVAVFHWPAKVWYLCMAWTNFIHRPKTSRPWLYLTKHHQSGSHASIPYL